MKNLSKTLAKGLLVMTLFTGISLSLSTSGISTINEAHAAVSYQQVYSYLVNHGYTVITLEETPGKANEDWIAHTAKNGIEYLTTVHVQGTNIIGHDDVVW